MLKVQFKNLSDLNPFCFVDDQFRSGLLDVVSKQRHPARPFSFSTCGGNFVPGTFRDDLSFELGEGQQHVQHQPSHRVGGVEQLCDRNKGHPVLFERFEDPGEVEQRPAEAVDLIDHHAVDSSRFDVLHQSPQSGAFHVAAGESSVIVGLWNQYPAF